MTRALWVVVVSSLWWACKSTPEVVDEKAPPVLASQTFEIVSQSLTDCDVKLTGTVESPDQAVTLEKARYEFVVDGEVRRSGEKPLHVAVPAGGSASFELSETLTYVKDEEDLRKMDARGGALLTALRGTLVVKTAGGETVELEFARSKDVRTPRLPHLRLREFEAGRFSETEVQVVFHLGVENPNPFYVSISGIEHTVVIADKEVKKGTIGAGEKLTPASTGVFDVSAVVNEETHGKDVAKLIKGLVLPFRITGQLTAPMYVEPVEFKGEIKLNPPR